MATNTYFNQNYKPEQYLLEDLVIESLQIYGQDVLYLPREVVSSDDILNDEYAEYMSAYAIEMYIANTDGFEGEGDLLSKFGLEIRDQATFIVAKRRFSYLVSNKANALDYSIENPREGDLIYLPLSRSMFEIKHVEHEKPFFQLNQLSTFELHCELFEYSNEMFETGIREVDQLEELHGIKMSIEITGGTHGLHPGQKIYQTVDGVTIMGEVAKFVETGTDPRVADLYLSQAYAGDGSFQSFDTKGSNIFLVEDDNDTEWAVTKIYSLLDKKLPSEPTSQNDDFEREKDDIIDFSESNPFSEGF